MSTVSVPIFAVFGAVLAILALILFSSWLTGIWRTQCWSNTVTPFSQKLLYGSLAQPGLGNMDKFVIGPLYLDETCLKGIYFIKRQYPSDCASACTKSGLDSSTVEWCQEECFKKCGKEKGDCIALIPTKSKWYDVVGWFATRNKPVVYSSGKYILDIDSSWTVSGNKGGIFPGYDEKCVMFTISEKETYKVEPSTGSGCNA